MNKFLPRFGVSQFVVFLLCPLFLLCQLTTFAANYYVTQYGGANHDGLSWPSAWSVDDFNATRLPAGGDIVTFSGGFTTPLVPASDGNAVNRLTLDLTAAVLYPSSTAIQISARSYLTILGGSIGGIYRG